MYYIQAAYDKVRAAKKQAEERTRRLDDKRKKIKLGDTSLSLQSRHLWLFFTLPQNLIPHYRVRWFHYLLFGCIWVMFNCLVFCFFFFLVHWLADLEARERQAEAEVQKTEEFKITRTLKEEVRTESWNRTWHFQCYNLWKIVALHTCTHTPEDTHIYTLPLKSFRKPPYFSIFFVIFFSFYYIHYCIRKKKLFPIISFPVQIEMSEKIFVCQKSKQWCV